MCVCGHIIRIFKCAHARKANPASLLHTFAVCQSLHLQAIILFAHFSTNLVLCLPGNQYEYFPIIATFVAGYAVIVLEEQTEINKAATALVLGVP